jgi:hypothetical protein
MEVDEGEEESRLKESNRGYEYDPSMLNTYMEISQ